MHLLLNLDLDLLFFLVVLVFFGDFGNPSTLIGLFVFKAVGLESSGSITKLKICYS